MADPEPPQIAVKCATCKGKGKVLLRDGTYVNCLPCSIPLYPNIRKDVPGAVATGPGDASEETTQ